MKDATAREGAPGTHRGAHQGRAGRAAFAQTWRERYGKAIDCPELVQVASRSAVDKVRLLLRTARVHREYAELIERLKLREIAFLKKRLRGERANLLENLNSLAKSLEGDESLGVARPTGKAIPLPTIVWRREIETDKLVRWLRDAVAEWPRDVGRRGPVADLAFARTCFEVGEWVRARHCDRRGEPDEQTSWPDVVRCLEWYGHDLSAVGAKKSDAVRLRAARWVKAARAATRDEAERRRQRA